MVGFKDVIERPDCSLLFLVESVSHLNGTKEAPLSKTNILNLGSFFFHLNQVKGE